MKARLYLIAIISSAVLVLFTSETNFFLNPIEVVVNGKGISLSGQMIILLIALLTVCLTLTLGIIDKIVGSFGAKKSKESEIKEKM
jgi:hypothetical protein